MSVVERAISSASAIVIFFIFGKSSLPMVFFRLRLVEKACKFLSQEYDQLSVGVSVCTSGVRP